MKTNPSPSPQPKQRTKVNITIDIGLTKIASILVLAWWATGIAVAPWFWWKLAACLPPVGMVIAVDRALTVYAPEMVAPKIEPSQIK